MSRSRPYRYSYALMAFMFALLIFLVLANVIVVSTHRSQMTGEVKEHMKGELDLLSAIMTEPLLTKDHGKIKKFVRTWGQDHQGVVSIDIVLPDGSYLLQLDKSGDVARTYSQERMVYSGETELALIRMTRDAAPEETMLGRLQWQLVSASVFITMLLGVVLWRIMQAMAVQPLEKEVAIRRETEDLLQKSRDGLEVKVRERTRELRESNEKLLSEIQTRHSAEDSQKKSHEMLKTVLDSINAIVYVADMETYEVLFVNKYMKDLFGELEGRTCWQVIQQGQSAPCPFCSNARLLNDDGSPAGVYQWEFQNTSNGRWYEIMDRAIEWIDGRIVRMEIAVDSTQRKQSEEILQKIARNVSVKTGDDFFQSMVRFLGEELGMDYVLVGKLKESTRTIETVAVYALGDIDQNIEYRLEHTPCENVVGRDACFYPDSIQAQFPEDKLLVDMGTESYAGIPLFSADGRRLGLIALLSREAMKLGDKDRILAIMKVFSARAAAEIERQAAENALRVSEEKFAKAFRSSPTYISLSTLDRGVFIDINDSFLEATGYTREELIGQSALDLGIWVDPHDRENFVRQLEQSGSVSNEELHLKMKGGTVRTVLYSAEVIRVENEPCIISVGLDITERKALEDQLLQAQKMEAVGQLAGGVAHDFNNILTAIISNSYLLQGRAGEDGVSRDLAEKIITLSNNAAKVVQELLMFSRKQKVQTTIIHLNDVVRETERLLTDFVGDHVQIACDLTDDGLSVLADRNQVEQIIINLATNARDAMPHGGVITIKTGLTEMDDEFIRLNGFGKPGVYAFLSVTDTGVGMKEDVREKIFEPFFTTKDVGKGTGLGLSIVYGIVRQHKGYIKVYSSEGQGSTFAVYLQRAEILAEGARAGQACKR